MDSRLACKLIPQYLHAVSVFICLPLMAFIICIDICLRYLFSAPLFWGKEVVGLLLFVSLTASLPYCQAQGRNVHMDILYKNLGKAYKRIADCLCALCGAVFSGFITLDAVHSLPHMIKFKESGELTGVPHWPFGIVVIVCCSVLFALFVLQFVNAAQPVFAKGKR